MLTLPEYAGVKSSKAMKTELKCINEENLNFLKRCRATFLYVLYQNGPITDLKRFEESKRIEAEKRGLISLMKQNRDLSLYKDIRERYLKQREMHTPQNEAIKKIQEQWASDHSLLHYSNAVLSSIAFEILPAVNAYIEFARMELKHKRRAVPKTVCGAVTCYCLELESWSARIKRALVDAMADRLLTISESSLIDKVHFNQFHDVLETESHSDAFRKLQTASWLKSDTHYQTTQVDGKYLLIPTALVSSMPSSKWRRIRAHVLGKESWCDYLAKHRHTFAMCRIHSKPIQVNDASQCFNQMNVFTAQLNVISHELTMLDAARPQHWWTRLWQAGKFKRIDGLSTHWRNEVTQMVERCVNAVAELISQWQDAIQLNGTLHVTLEQRRLVAAMVAFTKSAHAIGGMSDAQLQKLDTLQMQYAALYEYDEPEQARIQFYLTQMAKGILENDKQLLLEEYLEDLKDKSIQNELNDFLQSPAVKQAVAGILPIATQHLNNLARKNECLTEVNVATLAKSFYWVLELGSGADKTVLQSQLNLLRQNYLSSLISVPLNRTAAWFTQCEAILATLYEHMGDNQQASVMKDFQLRRLAETEMHGAVSNTLQQAAIALHAEHDKEQWRNKCIAKRDALVSILWSGIDAAFITHKAACHQTLEKLVSAAVALGKSSITELPLEPYQKNLISMDTKDKQPLRSLDSLIWAMKLTFEKSAEDLAEIFQRLEECEQRSQRLLSKNASAEFKKPQLEKDNSSSDTTTLHSLHH